GTLTLFLDRVAEGVALFGDGFGGDLFAQVATGERDPGRATADAQRVCVAQLRARGIFAGSVDVAELFPGRRAGALRFGARKHLFRLAQLARAQGEATQRECERRAVGVRAEPA